MSTAPQPDPRGLERDIERLKAAFKMYADGSQSIAESLKRTIAIVFDLERRIQRLEQNWGGEGFGPTVLK